MASNTETATDGQVRKTALILAGGSGTRLWPLSRNLLPKQLLALDGDETLLQQTVKRVATAFDPVDIWIVTNEEHVFEVRKQIKAVDESMQDRVLAEPVGRNTLPAIMLGLAGAGADSDKDVVAVFPSDHLVKDHPAFAKSLALASDIAATGKFVTFGIRPDKPETGYGYVRRGRELGRGAFEVEGFIEKPDEDKAAELVAAGNTYWNSGMFVFRADTFLAAVEEHEPELWQWWEEKADKPMDTGYGRLPNVSVDYGVAERIRDIAVVEASFDWDDLGSWEAMRRLGVKDASGNVVQGDVLSLDCEGCLLLSRGGKLAAVGLKDVIIVQTRDATLALDVSDVQKVKDVVERLKAEGSPLVECHVTVYRPWGSYTVLEEGPHYKIKRIAVSPGSTLSKQMHHHRSEHWVVVSGTALVEVNDVETLLVENQSVDIPKTATHRLSNPGRVPVEIIEIQSGPYLEEDDIVRFEDVYGRVKK